MLIDVEQKSVQTGVDQFVPDCGCAKAKHSHPVSGSRCSLRQLIYSLACKPPLAAEWIGCWQADKQFLGVRRRKYARSRGSCALGLVEKLRYKIWVGAFTLKEDLVKVGEALANSGLNSMQHILTGEALLWTLSQLCGTQSQPPKSRSNLTLMGAFNHFGGRIGKRKTIGVSFDDADK